MDPGLTPSSALSVDITGAALTLSSFTPTAGAAPVNGAGIFTCDAVAPACFLSTASKFVFHTITLWSSPPDAK